MWKQHVNLLLQSFRSVSSDLHQCFISVSTKLIKYIVFTMQTYKKLLHDYVTQKYQCLSTSLSFNHRWPPFSKSAPGAILWLMSYSDDGKVVLRGAQRLQHSKNRTTCSGLLKTALNNVLLPTLFNVVNNIVQHCWAWIHLSDVQRKTGAELVHNGIVGPNLARHLLSCSQIRPTMPLETSSAPVFLWTSERRISLRSGVTMLNKLLTTLNNMGCKTLFNPVFNSPEQVVRFSMCMIILYQVLNVTSHTYLLKLILFLTY